MFGDIDFLHSENNIITHTLHQYIVLVPMKHLLNTYHNCQTTVRSSICTAQVVMNASVATRTPCFKPLHTVMVEHDIFD